MVGVRWRKEPSDSSASTTIHSPFPRRALDPNALSFPPTTAVVGGKLNAFGSNARLGKGEWIVVEADESDGSFLHLTPTIAVVTNVDPEHLDHYGTAEALQQAFVDFADRVPFYGLVVLCRSSHRPAPDSATVQAPRY